jgi:hypothetical protein
VLAEQKFKNINFYVLIYLIIAISIWIGLAFFYNEKTENELVTEINASELLEAYQSDKNFINNQKGKYFIVSGSFKKFEETKSDIVISVTGSGSLIFFSRPSETEFDMDTWTEGDMVTIKGKLKGDRYDGFNELFDRINIDFMNTEIISHQKKL